MLPFSFRQNRHLGSDPLCGGFGAAGGADPALTTEVDPFCVGATRVTATKRSPSQNMEATAQQQDHVIHDRLTDGVGILQIVVPPYGAFLEQMFEA